MNALETPKVRDKAVRAKIARHRAGKPARTLDLFAGCGGLSLGLHAAGFALTAAVEFNPVAARSHANNFFDADAHHAVARDITALCPSQLAAEFDIGKSVCTSVGVLVRGPPCQALYGIGYTTSMPIPEQFDEALIID